MLSNSDGCVVAPGSDRKLSILVAVGIARPNRVPVIALAVNSLLSGAISNLQPLEKMLDCDSPADIPIVLEFFQISSPECGFLDHLGLKIDDGTQRRLAVIDGSTGMPPAGSEIAWRESGSAPFKYGQLASSRVDGGEIKVEVATNVVRLLTVANLRAIRTVEEMRASVKECAEEMQAAIALARDADTELFENDSLPADSRAPAAVVKSDAEALERKEILRKLDAMDPGPEKKALRMKLNALDRRLALSDSGGDATNDDGGDNSSPDDRSDVAEATVAPIERVLYTPDDPNWEANEDEVLSRLKKETDEAQQTLEVEPAGVNELLEVQGFKVPGEAREDVAFADTIDVTVSTDVKRGYDIVRTGNVGGVAFFHQRTELFTEARRELLAQAVDVLKDVCACFGYNPLFVTLFYQVRILTAVISRV